MSYQLIDPQVIFFIFPSIFWVQFFYRNLDIKLRKLFFESKNLKFDNLMNDISTNYYRMHAFPKGIRK